MADARSSAIVLFGITGDLAKKKLFPALYHLEERNRLPETVIGVASSDLPIEEVIRRCSESVLAAEPKADAKVLDSLCRKLQYVSGDYRDDSTYQNLADLLADCRGTLFYLAIPPALFDDVVTGLLAKNCTAEGRVVVEKPFGRDFESARELNEVLHRA